MGALGRAAGRWREKPRAICLTPHARFGLFDLNDYFSGYTRRSRGGLSMKCIACLALTAIWLVAGSAYGATARCVAYGDDKTDFTWRSALAAKNMSGNTSTSALEAISIGLRVTPETAGGRRLA
jgi:hypothetical protein